MAQEVHILTCSLNICKTISEVNVMYTCTSVAFVCI